MICNKYTLSFLHILLCMFLGATPFWSSPSIIIISIFICTVVLISYIVNGGCIVSFMERELYKEYYVDTLVNFKRLWRGIDEVPPTGSSKSRPKSHHIIRFSLFILAGLISLYLTCNAKTST